jgi:hypothetical protein
MRRVHKAQALTAVGLIAVSVVAYICMASLDAKQASEAAAVQRLVDSNSALPFDKIQFDSVVQAVAAGTIPAERHGVVILPKTLSSVTVDGKVYATSGHQMSEYLFVVWRGKGSNMQGYLKVSPLNGLNWPQGPPPASMTASMPIFTGSGFDARLSTVDVMNSEGNNWFEVSYDED